MNYLIGTLKKYIKQSVPAVASIRHHRDGEAYWKSMYSFNMLCCSYRRYFRYGKLNSSLLVIINMLNTNFVVKKYPPQFMKVKEHETASVPCKVLGTNLSPNWNITGKHFSPSFLPSGHSYNGTALNIKDISMNRNGSTYCCFLVFKGGRILASNVTTLTVISQKTGKPELSTLSK